MAEVCRECGEEYTDIYRVPDDLWLRVMGNWDGTLCMACFAQIVRYELGRELYWEAALDDYPTNTGQGDSR